MISDTPMKPVDLFWKRERAPAEGVRGSNNPTQFFDSTRGGGNKDTQGSGKGKREQASVEEAKDSDDPSTSLNEDAMDTSETLAGKRKRAPVEEVTDSDIPIQSTDKASRLGDLHVAFVMDEEVVKEHAQWRQTEMKEKVDTQTRMAPGRPDGGRSGAGSLCVGCGKAQPHFGAEIGGG